MWACNMYHLCNFICGCKYTRFHMCMFVSVSSACWMTPQPVGLLHASSLFIVFLFVWLTCHPQKMFASPRHSRLDTLARSQPGLCLKKDRQLDSGLFIVPHTCSHPWDYVLIRRLTQGDQGLSSCTLSLVIVIMLSKLVSYIKSKLYGSFL